MKWYESLWRALTGSGLTGAQQEANAFSASEAQAARNWTEKMYQQYESPSALMQQYIDAGLNPALMYGGTVGGNVGSAAAAPSSVGAESPQALGLLEFALSSALGAAEVGLKRKQGANIDAQTSEIEARKEYYGAMSRNLNSQTRRTDLLTESERDEILSRISLNKYNMSKAEADTALAFSQVALNDVNQRTLDEYNRVRIAEIKARYANTEADTKRLNQQVENLKRDFVLSFSHEAVLKAQAGLLDEQTKNALEENGLIHFNAETSKWESMMSQYRYDKRKINQAFDLVDKGASALRDAGVGIGSVATSWMKGLTLRGLNQSPARPRDFSQPGNLTYPYTFME